MKEIFYSVPKDKLTEELNRCSCVSEIRFYSPTDIKYAIRDDQSNDEKPVCNNILKNLEKSIKHWEREKDITQQVSILKISNRYESQCIYSKGASKFEEILFPDSINKDIHISNLRFDKK
jgi:hypothetical protein